MTEDADGVTAGASVRPAQQRAKRTKPRVGVAERPAPVCTRVGAGGKVRLAPTHASSLTMARQKLFLDTLAATSSVSASAKAIGTALSVIYRHRQRDAGFAASWDLALEIAYDRLEQAMLAYVVSRFSTEAIDPDEADPAAAAASLAARVAAPEVSRTDLEMAMSLLNRGQRQDGRFTRKRVATRAESDAVVREKLALLAKRLVAR